MPIPISYNVRNVMQRPVATLTTAIGIGLTVTIFIGALALAAGFQAALLQTGSLDNAIALRKGADSEISSGVSREAADILRAGPDVAIGPEWSAAGERRAGRGREQGTPRAAWLLERHGARRGSLGGRHARRGQDRRGPHVHARHR